MNRKQTSLLLFIIFISLLFVGCNRAVTTTDLMVEQYLPSKTNQEVTLSSDNSHNKQKIITEYIEDNKVQLRKLSSSTTVVEHWEYKDDGIYIVFAQEEFYESINTLDMKPTKNELILKAPLKVGNSWDSESGYAYKITSVNYPLETYAGDFNTIEVTSTDGSMVRKYYFAPGLGIIKSSISFDDNSTIDSEIFSLSESPYNPKDYRFYYYDSTKDELFYTVDGVLNYEPERMSNYMLKMLKEPPIDFSPTLNQSAKINSVTPVYKKDILYVDFSKDLNLTDIDYAIESSLLQCIVNTFGYNFEISNVILTIEGKPYTSENITMNKDESFKVDLSNGIEIIR